MNIQEKIEAVVEKVRWLVRNNKVASALVNGCNDIGVDIRIKPDGQFELVNLKFGDPYGIRDHIDVVCGNISYVSPNPHPGGKEYQVGYCDYIYVTTLFEFGDWDKMMQCVKSEDSNVNGAELDDCDQQPATFAQTLESIVPNKDRVQCEKPKAMNVSVRGNDKCNVNCIFLDEPEATDEAGICHCFACERQAIGALKDIREGKCNCIHTN